VLLPAPLPHSVFLVRHGRTELNADGRLRGHLDPPLDEVGRREVDDLARALAPTRPRRILTSPLSRAVQTAGAIAARAEVRAALDERLVDRDYGLWAGRRPEDVIARWGSLDEAPGVEFAAAVVLRVRGVLEEVFDPADPAPVVLVAHDAVNRLLLADLDPQLGRAEAIGQRTACWNVVRHVEGRWLVDVVDAKAW
jgi:broad specificity phosphatase PhoE